MACDIFGKIGKVLFNLGSSVEALAENRKKDALKSLFGAGKSLTELTIETTSCAIKYAPDAISTIKDIKKEVVSSIEKDIYEYQKEKKLKAFDDKIKKLSNKNSSLDKWL